MGRGRIWTRGERQRHQALLPGARRAGDAVDALRHRYPAAARDMTEDLVTGDSAAQGLPESNDAVLRLTERSDL
jgi:hypothetical protein